MTERRRVPDVQAIVQLIHRCVGYPTAFIIAPIALITYASSVKHRWAGKTYFYLMVFLYLTGLFMTLTRHPWLTWDFARNVTFNFFGFSMVLYGYRAIYLFYNKDAPRPTRLDYLLTTVLFISVAGMLAVAIRKDTPMRVFTAVGIAFCAMEVVELKQRFQPRDVLFRRHIRYILASYFYVLTVASIVHLDGEMSGKMKWLWPTMLGAAMVYIATSTQNRFLAKRRGQMLRYAVTITTIVGVTFGAYATYELIRGRPGSGQRMEQPMAQPRERQPDAASPASASPPAGHARSLPGQADAQLRRALP